MAATLKVGEDVRTVQECELRMMANGCEPTADERDVARDRNAVRQARPCLAAGYRDAVTLAQVIAEW